MSKPFVLAVLCATFSLSHAVAQNATGSIHGIVKDEQRAVIPHATITATNQSTGTVRTAGTSAAGVYTLESLMPGEYEVKVEAPGFTAKIQMATVQVGGTTSAEFALQVLGTIQSVTISSEAPMINTTETQIGGVISRERVANLPLNGR